MIIKGGCKETIELHGQRQLLKTVSVFAGFASQDDSEDRRSPPPPGFG